MFLDILFLIDEAEKLRRIMLMERKAGRRYDAIPEIEKACLRVTGLPFSLVKGSAPEELWELLQRGSNGYVKAIELAGFLILDAEISNESGNVAEAVRSRILAYCLLGESIGVLPAEEKVVYRAKMDDLEKELAFLVEDSYVRGILEKYRKEDGTE